MKKYMVEMLVEDVCPLVTSVVNEHAETLLSEMKNEYSGSGKDEPDDMGCDSMFKVLADDYEKTKWVAFHLSRNHKFHDRYSIIIMKEAINEHIIKALDTLSEKNGTELETAIKELKDLDDVLENCLGILNDTCPLTNGKEPSVEEMDKFFRENC